MSVSVQSAKVVLASLLAMLVLAGCNLDTNGSAFQSASDAQESAGAASDNDTSGNSGNSSAPRSVSLYWSAPMQRINGEDITVEDLGGFEIRYRKESDASYTRIVIDNPAIDQYHIDGLEGDDYRFEVAAFDENGLYSDFVVAAR